MHGQNKTGEDRTTPAPESSMPPSHVELDPFSVSPDMKRHDSTRSKRSSGYNSMVLEPVLEEVEPLMKTTSLHDHEQVSISSPRDQVTATGMEVLLM